MPGNVPAAAGVPIVQFFLHPETWITPIACPTIARTSASRPTERLPMRLVRLLDRAIGQVLAWARWLVLPVAVLLFLQWPLRDLTQAYSREANDLGQWLFALYVAAAFTAATRAGTHLCVDALAHRYSLRTRTLLMRLGLLFGLVPWALFVLIAGGSMVVSSVRLTEAFPETGNPGYFLVKTAVWVLAGLVLAEALVGLALPDRAPQDPR
jgi:TRAP-type mannitol/chloroaromatic compound transport system permease small subunit